MLINHFSMFINVFPMKNAIPLNVIIKFSIFNHFLESWI